MEVSTSKSSSPLLPPSTTQSFTVMITQQGDTPVTEDVHSDHSESDHSSNDEESSDHDEPEHRSDDD